MEQNKHTHTHTHSALPLQLKFELPGEKPKEFHSSRRDSVEVIGLITAQLKNVFPITPLE